MDQVCFALPILPGKMAGTRAFMHELEGARKGEYAASERRIGIVQESWYVQERPEGDLLVAYMESPNFGHALATFAASHDAFDRWFKQSLADITGVDLNDPPPGPLSEQLSSYES